MGNRANFSDLWKQDVFNPPFAAPSTRGLESKKAPKGWRDDSATAHWAMDGPFGRPGLQDFRAQESSGNGAPFSLVRFFWANKRNEHQTLCEYDRNYPSQKYPVKGSGTTNGDHRRLNLLYVLQVKDIRTKKCSHSGGNVGYGRGMGA